MKTTFSYDHYFAYEELKSNILYFAEKFPQIVTAEVICVTAENRNVYAVTVTNKETGNALSKPAFHVDGNHHAGEITGSMAAMHMLDYIVTNYGQDPKITHLVDTMTFYFVPRVSPDGTETWITTPYIIRSVNRPNNVVKGGIQEADLDGDGVIRMMRIPTPFGAWKKDPTDSSLMCPRDPGDREGEFYDIYPEGYLEEFEGDENLKRKKAEWSLDFNRNYPYGWFPETRQPGAGKYPLSNPENKAMADWIINHPNIGGVATNHTSGGVILYPPGTKPEAKAPQNDIKAFLAIAEMCREELGYEPLNIYDAFITDPENYDSGAFDDWCYETHGIPTYTIEYWDLAKRAGVPHDFANRKREDLNTVIKRFNAEMKWIKENALPEDYLDWTPYEHPTFGPVELGGFNFKFTVQNAPCKFLKEVMEPSTRFLLRFAQAVPNLVIDQVSAKQISEDIYEVTAVVGNTGYLPTNLTDTAAKLKIHQAVEASISGCEVVTGQTDQKVDALSGYSRTITDASAYGNLTTYANAPAKKKFIWIVKAASGSKITIKASQIKAGSVEKTISL